MRLVWTHVLQEHCGNGRTPAGEQRARMRRPVGASHANKASVHVFAQGRHSGHSLSSGHLCGPGTGSIADCAANTRRHKDHPSMHVRCVPRASRSRAPVRSRGRRTTQCGCAVSRTA